MFSRELVSCLGLLPQTAGMFLKAETIEMLRQHQQPALLHRPACPTAPPLRLLFLQVPGCSLWFNGTFYDNVSTGRRGVTSLNWPKPKIKLDSKQGSVRAGQQQQQQGGGGGGEQGGRRRRCCLLCATAARWVERSWTGPLSRPCPSLALLASTSHQLPIGLHLPPPFLCSHLQIFKIRPGMTVGELNLNSQWQEPGENTFMREPLTWEAFGQASRQAAGGGVGRQRKGWMLAAMLVNRLPGQLCCLPAGLPLQTRLPRNPPALQMGVESLVSFHLHMRMNGKYFGKYSYVEQMDEDTLAVN